MRSICLYLVLLTLPISQSMKADTLSFWVPCTKTNAAKEGRKFYIADDLKINTIGTPIDDLEDNFCVTKEKCIAFGFCQASSPEEQLAADKIKNAMGGDIAKLKSDMKGNWDSKRAKDVEHKRKVDAQLKALGGNESNRANAERLVKLKEQVAKSGQGESNCSVIIKPYTKDMFGESEQIARSQMVAAMKNSGFACGDSPAVSISDITCKDITLKPLENPKPPVGNCLACISEELAAKFYGWKKGVGYPAPVKEKTKWACSVTAKCNVSKCGNKATKA